MNKGEKDFIFSGMSDQIFGPIYFKESWPRDIFILGK